MAVLEVHDLHKRFRQVEVLRGATLEVGPGEIVGVVGENGSGKSTLLRIIVGMLRQDRGTVTVNGRYGYCPQEPLVFDNLTTAENISYFGAAYGLPQGEAMARGGQLMDRLRLRRHADRVVGVLSGGTRQKLNLIVSLLHEPDVLMLDEPYQGFDYESYLAFWDLAKEMAAESRSVVVVSHLVHDTAHLSKLYRLVEGRTVLG